jgi:hypothetical protein
VCLTCVGFSFHAEPGRPAAGQIWFVRFGDTFMLTSIAFNPLRPDVPGFASASSSLLYSMLWIGVGGEWRRRPHRGKVLMNDSVCLTRRALKVESGRVDVGEREENCAELSRISEIAFRRAEARSRRAARRTCVRWGKPDIDVLLTQGGEADAHAFDKGSNARGRRVESRGTAANR